MFDVVAHAPAPPGRQALFVPISLGLHATAVALLLASSMWRVGEIGEPPLGLPPIYLPQPSSEPAVGNPPPKGGSPGPERHTSSRALVSPNEIPTMIPLAMPPDLAVIGKVGPDGPPTGEEVGTNDGPEGPGCPTCPGTGPASRSAIYPLGGDVNSPVALFQPSPTYPDLPRQLRITGLVVLEAVIAADGSVEEVHALAGANPLLAQAAADAVTRWKYRPGTLNGRAVRVRLSVTVKFSLNG